jgi:DNA-binding protein HU-beta
VEVITVKSNCKALLELSESERREQVSRAKLLKEIIMPPAKKSATAKKVAPAAKVTTPAKKAAPAAKVTAPSKKAAPPNKAAAPTKNAVAVKAAPQVTITLRQIAAELAEGHDLPKKQAEAVLGGLVALTTQHLKKGDKIRLTGLGILQVRARPARMGRNPATVNRSRSPPAKRSHSDQRRN